MYGVSAGWLVALVALALGTGCGQRSGGASPDPRNDGSPAGVAIGAEETAAREAAVLAELEAYYADFSARDWPAFASHFWEGATLTTAWQPPGEDAVRVVVTTVPEFVARAAEGPGSREIFEERMTTAEVRLTGNLAQVWARYAARFGDPGDIMEWEGTDAFTLMELDGRWKITSLAFAGDADPDADPGQ